MSGEEPIYTTKAQVFQIDPKTRRNWIPACSQPIHVNYYYDTNRGIYRIISVDGTKAVINSTITPNMTFTKTSQKFGQWSDPKANTIYGLGFPCEGDINKFHEKFVEVCKITAAKKEQSQNAVTAVNSVPNTPNAVTNGSPNSNSVNDLNRDLHNESQSSLDRCQSISDRSQSISPGRRSPSTLTYSQLQYENDRLRLALTTSSANSKKWEVELTNLTDTNAKLTNALQDSTSKVAEWKKQLDDQKKECEELKKKLAETNSDVKDDDELTEKRVGELSDRIHLQEQQIKQKDSEIEDLSAKLERIQVLENQCKTHNEKVKNLEKENSELKDEKAAQDLLVDQLKHEQETTRNELLKLQRQVGVKLQELSTLHDQITRKLQS